MGWKVVGALPARDQYILIVAPHTSNWDLIIGLCARFAVDVKINFMAKHQLFFFPLGTLLTALGGIAVNRDKSASRVERTIELFKTHRQLKLALAPEGTRSPVLRWKEGFYYMACQSQVPIVMVGLDYATKEVRIQEPFWPTEDKTKDFSVILDYFRTVHGKYPKNIPDYTEKK